MTPSKPSPKATAADAPRDTAPVAPASSAALAGRAARRVESSEDTARDLADVSAVELISTVSVHMLSAAALRCGLADEGEDLQDLGEARIMINALAGLITAAAPDLGDTHARALRDGLRSVQLAFREASAVPDEPGQGPGEKYTGAVG